MDVAWDWGARGESFFAHVGARALGWRVRCLRRRPAAADGGRAADPTTAPTPTHTHTHTCMKAARLPRR